MSYLYWLQQSLIKSHLRLFRAVSVLILNELLQNHCERMELIARKLGLNMMKMHFKLLHKLLRWDA